MANNPYMYKNKISKAQKQPKLNPDFKIGNLATDLVAYTLDICNKEDGKPPRFPAKYYDSYVTEIVRSAITLHKKVCYANAKRVSEAKRAEAQEDAIGECVNLEHLILLAYDRGWISDKQHSFWQNQICGLHYMIIRWMTAV